MIFEPGRCDSNCSISYISCSDEAGCTFGNCKLEGLSSLFTVPSDVPLKRVLKGSSISPWVRIRFESQFSPDGNAVSPATCSVSGGAAKPSDFWDFTEITTGNISQPNHTDQCRAAIKSFQYGWGTQDAGNKCKVTVVDEKGSSLNAWISRLFRNTRNTPVGAAAAGFAGSFNFNTIPQGVYKMKVTFGWLIIGGEDNECPIDGSFYGPASCTPAVDSFDEGWTSYSTKPNRLICSPPIYFIPNELNVTTTNGKYIYEIEGTDTMQRAQEQPSARVYGSGANPIHLGLAIKKMAAESNPPFEVDFLQIGNNGVVEPLLFTTPVNQGKIVDINTTAPLNATTNLGDTSCVITSIPLHLIPGTGGPQPPIPGCLDFFRPPAAGSSTRRAFERLGPLGTWPCHELSPLATLHTWINNVSAQGRPQSGMTGSPPPRGIVINYDPTYTTTREVTIRGTPCQINFVGRLVLWANPLPHCAQPILDYSQIKAAYIVNGGNCSPVISFNPNMKWSFQALASGGGTGTGSGRMASMRDGQGALRCRLPGRGPRTNLVVGDIALNQGAEAAVSNRAVNLAAHQTANPLHNPVEAELKIQGDPSDYFCTPFLGYGRSLSLVVINPFYLDGDNTNGCSLSWSTLTSSSCNSVLTNNHWFITGVDHQINNGSFVTTIKVRLVVPNSEVNARNQVVGGVAGGVLGIVALGGEAETPGGIVTSRYACAQGTLPCTNDVTTPYGNRGQFDYQVGPAGTQKGDFEFCTVNCAYHPGPGRDNYLNS